MTVSVGTFNDLRGGKSQPVDRNPYIDCKGKCGDTFEWRDYWKDRVVTLGGDPRTDPFLCDECLAEAVQYHDRSTKNRQLTDYDSQPDGDGDE